MLLYDMYFSWNTNFVVTLKSGSIIMSNISGLSTHVGVATFQSNVFVDGTLTAGLIDGGSF